MMMIVMMIVTRGCGGRGRLGQLVGRFLRRAEASSSVIMKDCSSNIILIKTKLESRRPTCSLGPSKTMVTRTPSSSLEPGGNASQSFNKKISRIKKTKTKKFYFNVDLKPKLACLPTVQWQYMVKMAIYGHLAIGPQTIPVMVFDIVDQVFGWITNILLHKSLSCRSFLSIP